MRRTQTKQIALGGMLTAVSLTIMYMGGFIPLATYVCPMLCIFTLYVIFRLCGKKIAWCGYAAVSVLGLLIAPDKEAAAVFVLLGYYPMIKPILEKSPLRWILKLLLFNGAVVVLYAIVLRIMGLSQISEEFAGFGMIGLGIMLVLGNITFFLMDKLLTIAEKKWNKRR